MFAVLLVIPLNHPECKREKKEGESAEVKPEGGEKKEEGESKKKPLKGRSKSMSAPDSAARKDKDKEKCIVQ